MKKRTGILGSRGDLVEDLNYVVYLCVSVPSVHVFLDS